MWIKKNTEVEVQEELEYDNTNIQVTNAYEAEVTGCRLSESKAEGSKSVSLVVDVKTEDGETNRTFFTVMGKDGETYFESTVKGNKVKKQHFGLSIANTLFELTLGKEIFDCDPSEVEFQAWDKEAEEMVTKKAEGFPEIIGKKIGICLQMNREISGTDSKEYGTMEHFFDIATGLFSNEDPESKKTKLDKWLGSMKDFKVTEKEAKNKSSFGNKKKTEDAGDEKPKNKWGR